MVFKRLKQLESDVRELQISKGLNRLSEQKIYEKVMDDINREQCDISECEFPKIFVHNVRADVETVNGDDRLMDFEIRYDIEYTMQTKSGNSHDSSVYLSFDKTPNAEDIELAIKEDLLSI